MAKDDVEFCSLLISWETSCLNGDPPAVLLVFGAGLLSVVFWFVLARVLRRSFHFGDKDLDMPSKTWPSDLASHKTHPASLLPPFPYRSADILPLLLFNEASLTGCEPASSPASIFPTEKFLHR